MYSYTNNRPRYHQADLVSPLLERRVTLQDASQKQLRVLDLGYANNRFLNFFKSTSTPIASC
jgi:hypothetical protein